MMNFWETSRIDTLMVVGALLLGTGLCLLPILSSL
jgi:hypothetical protein